MPTTPQPSIDTIAARLQTFKPLRMPGRQWVARCGVIVLLADHDANGRTIEPAVLMMKRSERPGDPWSGHVSFPGGRVDASDANTRAAALRELQEETGFNSELGLEPIGRLSDRLTRAHGRPVPMLISPYVYRTDRAISLHPSDEAQALWWVPLSQLQTSERRGKLTWRLAGIPLPMACVELDGGRLWGLTLMMADELVRAVASARTMR